MPPASRKTSPEIGVIVDDIGRPFQPGDVVTGRIVRLAHVVCPTAVVEVVLLGRTKVKLGVTRSNGQSSQTTYYRGRFNFFDRTLHNIHHGPIHVPPGGPGESWEFSIQIPSRMSPRSVLSEHKNAERGSFVPLTHGAIASYPLPSSFYATGRKGNKKFESYVEYHIEASIAFHGSHSKTVTASLPIEVRASPMPYPLASLNLKSQLHMASVSTFRLVPGMEDAHLTFKQKTQKLFHSSKVPTLGFRLQMDTPTAIQLGNPAPVPVQVGIVPDRTRTSDIIHDAPQTALLTSLELILKAKTYVLANGGRCTYETDDVLKHRIHLPFHAITTGPVVTNIENPKEELQSPPPYQESGVKGQHPQDIKEHPSTHSEDKKLTSDASKVTGMSAPNSPRTDPSSTEGESSALGASGGNNHAIRGSTSKALLLPIKWGSDLSNYTPLDVGTLMDLHIFPNHISVLGNRSLMTAAGGIYPEFTSYCIKHEHSLKWKMTLEIAGECVKLEAEHPLSVSGPSADIEP